MAVARRVVQAGAPDHRARPDAGPEVRRAGLLGHHQRRGGPSPSPSSATGTSAPRRGPPTACAVVAAGGSPSGAPRGAGRGSSARSRPTCRVSPCPDPTAAERIALGLEHIRRQRLDALRTLREGARLAPEAGGRPAGGGRAAGPGRAPAPRDVVRLGVPGGGRRAPGPLPGPQRLRPGGRLAGLRRPPGGLRRRRGRAPAGARARRGARRRGRHERAPGGRAVRGRPGPHPRSLRGGFGWSAHPGELMERSSTAFADGGRVWLIDPLRAGGLDAELQALGTVAGVVVSYVGHERDADWFATYYGVPVASRRHLPPPGAEVSRGAGRGPRPGQPPAAGPQQGRPCWAGSGTPPSGGPSTAPWPSGTLWAAPPTTCCQASAWPSTLRPQPPDGAAAPSSRSASAPGTARASRREPGGAPGGRAHFAQQDVGGLAARPGGQLAHPAGAALGPGNRATG